MLGRENAAGCSQPLQAGGRWREELGELLEGRLERDAVRAVGEEQHKRVLACWRASWFSAVTREGKSNAQRNSKRDVASSARVSLAGDGWRNVSETEECSLC